MNGQPHGPKRQSEKPIDWQKVQRVLVILLRSIGDTVLSTPSLIALRRFLPDARIDILLEDWVAPLLENFEQIDNVIAVGKGDAERVKAAWKIRRNRYDVVFNLHGGTTATLLARASGARYRIGYADYQYSFLYNRKYSTSSEFWKAERTHSAEQQLALLGYAGVPVSDRPRGSLTVSESARRTVANRFAFKKDYALIHPASLFHTKQWSAENFAGIVKKLAARGYESVAVASKVESAVLESLAELAGPTLTIGDDLTLPEITALASNAKLFVGNDSGIAHIAAAVNIPTVVIFGSSNRDHWRPWTDASNEIVFNSFACQPCPGYECAVYGEPRCILGISVEQVITAIDKVLAKKEKGEPEPAF